MTRVRVREASLDDAEDLWRWANDPDTRAASHGRLPIPWDDHRSWMEARLSDGASMLLLGLAMNDRPIGSIRFESSDGWREARLSYVIAPEERGQGLATPLVVAGAAYLCERQPRVRIRAEVLAANARSLSIFRSLGWEERIGEGRHEFFTVCQRGTGASQD